MNIFIDIITVAIFALFIYSGYKRGIIYMVINIIGTFAASLISSFLASSMSVWLYNVAIQPRVSFAISEATKNITDTDPFKIAEQAMQNVSNFTANTLSSLGITANDIAKEIQVKNLDVNLIIENMIKPSVIKVISWGLTFIIFVLLMVVVSVIASKFTKAADHTVLAEALLMVMLLSVILSFVLSFTSPESYASWNDELNHTILYKPISQISIPDAIISKIVPK